MENNVDIINQKSCQRATSPMDISSAKSSMDPISFLNAAAQETSKIDPVVVNNYTRTSDTSDWICDVSVKFFQHIGHALVFDCYSVKLPVNLTLSGSGASKKLAKLNACSKLQQYLFPSFTLDPLHTRTTTRYSMSGDQPDLPKIGIDELEELITYHEIEHAKAQVENEQRTEKRHSRSTYKYTTISPIFPWNSSDLQNTTLPSILFTAQSTISPPTVSLAKLSLNSLSNSSASDSSSINSGSEEEPASAATNSWSPSDFPECTPKQQFSEAKKTFSPFNFPECMPIEGFPRVKVLCPLYRDEEDLIAL